MKTVFFLMAFSWNLCYGQTHLTTGTNNFLIGRNAAAHVTTQSYVIAIGDIDKPKVYKDFDIDIDKDYWYFKTCKGKAALAFIEGVTSPVRWSGGDGALVEALTERNTKIITYLKKNMLPDIIRYYNKRRT